MLKLNPNDILELVIGEFHYFWADKRTHSKMARLTKYNNV